MGDRLCVCAAGSATLLTHAPAPRGSVNERIATSITFILEITFHIQGDRDVITMCVVSIAILGTMSWCLLLRWSTEMEQMKLSTIGYCQIMFLYKGFTHSGINICMHLQFGTRHSSMMVWVTEQDGIAMRAGSVDLLTFTIRRGFRVVVVTAYSGGSCLLEPKLARGPEGHGTRSLASRCAGMLLSIE